MRTQILAALPLAEVARRLHEAIAKNTGGQGDETDAQNGHHRR